jgi:hypothetical protein
MYVIYLYFSIEIELPATFVKFDKKLMLQNV